MSTRSTPSAGAVLKRVLVGRPVASSGLEHTLLPKFLALPVFSSDPLSSVAYATEEILGVLLVATADPYRYVMPIALAIGSLLTIVVISYRQTVRAYPNGGGAYIVSKENLGVLPGLVAAAALLTDYVLTVSVSVVAGVLAMTSAAPGLHPFRVEIALGFVLFIMLANLRGVRESGILFAVPTYTFTFSILVLIGVGLVRCVGGCPSVGAVVPRPDVATSVGAVGLFTILRAFSSGATALTGVEAISNGVPAFRRPQAKNAADTLAIMGVIAVTMFIGISFLSSRMHPVVSNDRTIIAQIAHAVFGGGIGFYVVQILTTAILVLAANTSYQDFPRLSSILARDHFMPRQFMNRGDRLVFSNGVVVLTALASLLIVVFDADLTRLIQLYVVGVFTSFTLSQTGMVRHWRKEGRRGADAMRGWRRSMVINGIGAAATGVVLCVITATKFRHGAWIVIAAIPVIVALFRSIHRHYESVYSQLRRGIVRPGDIGTHRVVLIVRDFSSATAEALGYVKSIRPQEFHALYPVPQGTVPPQVQDRWRIFGGGAPDLEPLVGAGELASMRRYLKGIAGQPNDFVTVVIPEVVRERLFSYLLLRRDVIRLKAGLLTVPNVAVADVPVVEEHGRPIGVDGKPLIPQRTVTLVFVSGVSDATVRAVNYAQSLDATETRAITFELDPETAERIEMDWFDKRLSVPLDVVEAPFRDLTGPMLDEVHRYTARPDTVVTVVMPELIVKRWRHYLLHNQNALFVKRLLLFEERVVLTSVPFVLES
ncbi:MAG: APC family permease [Actinomycetota bacterium]|nr:APC family permease [Actinomycetota bacterium]